MDGTKRLAIVVAFLALCGVVYWYTLERSTEKSFGKATQREVNDIISIQQEYFNKHGRYRGVVKGEVSPYLEVTEYEAPEGHGYQAKQWEDRADGKWMRSFGTGPEAVERTFDWKLIESNVPYDPLATSTQ